MTQHKTTIRDEIAMSLPSKDIPELDDALILDVADMLNPDFNYETATLQQQMELEYKWQAYCRYTYADIMLNQRGPTKQVL